jgi:hypothetical protein
MHVHAGANHWLRAAKDATDELGVDGDEHVTIVCTLISTLLSCFFAVFYDLRGSAFTYLNTL